MAQKSDWINNVGKILESKPNDKGTTSLYIKMDKDISLQKGDVVRLQKQAESLQALLDNGVITEEEFDARSKHTFIKYVLHVNTGGRGE